MSEERPHYATPKQIHPGPFDGLLTPNQLHVLAERLELALAESRRTGYCELTIVLRDGKPRHTRVLRSEEMLP